MSQVDNSGGFFIAAIDFTSLRPGDEVLGMDGNKLTLDKVDVVLMNPPFLRQESLSKEQKIALGNAFSEYRLYFNGRSGLHAYFLFLADRFTLDDGKVAFVLPASILRAKSTGGLRKFLLNNYTIEYIVFGCETAAFSKLAQFREVIVIARKSKPQPCSQTAVSLLRKMPCSDDEENLFSSLLTEFLSSKRDRHSDAYLKAVKVRQLELIQNECNLYSFLCGLNSELPSLLEEIKEKGFSRLVTIDSLANKGVSISRFDYPSSNRNAFVIRQSRVSSKLKRNVHEWVITKEEGNQVTIMKQITGKTLTAQRDCFATGLRRTSKVNSIDLTSKLDLIIIKTFGGIDTITNEDCLKELKQSIDKRNSNLLLSRRIDVSSPGTCLLAFHSKEPAVGANMFGIKGLSEQEEKASALWFNSSFYLIQLLLNRTETTGAWLRIDKGALSQMLTIDLNKLGESEKLAATDLFDFLIGVRFPSILSQLQCCHVERRKIDMTIARLIGFSEEEANNFLDRLYPALVQEIQTLRQLMFQGIASQHLNLKTRRMATAASWQN